MLQSVGLQRVGHDLATEQQQIRKGKINRGHFLLMVLCLIGKMTLSQSQYKK